MLAQNNGSAIEIDPEAIGQAYDDLAGWYDQFYRQKRFYMEDRVIQQKLLQLIQPSSSMTKPYSVMDLGCGCGLGCEFLLERFNGSLEYTGVDISEMMIAQANDKFATLPRIRFYQGDAMDLLATETVKYNLVVSLNGSCSHFPSSFHDIMTHILDVLEPNGMGFLMFLQSTEGVFEDEMFTLCGTDKNITVRRISKEYLHYELLRIPGIEYTVDAHYSLSKYMFTNKIQYVFYRFLEHSFSTYFPHKCRYLIVSLRKTG